MSRSIFSLAATTLALVSASNAALIIDNFDSYTFGSNMDMQGGWTVTNGTPLNPLDGSVVIADSYTWDSPVPSVGSATVGGVQPTGAAVTSLYHSASLPFISSIGYGAAFSFETSYTESALPSALNRNNFQFVLSTSAGGGNLLTIDLTPAGAGQYNATWSSSFATGGLFGVFNGGDTTQFALNLFDNGGGVVGFSFSNAGAPVASGNLLGAAATDTITGFATNWYSASGGGPGGNSITIDNVSLVPEPSSALLGLLGTSCLFLRRRRA